MVFSSFVFLFYFLPATLISYYAFNNRVWRNIVLLFASLFFYTWGEPIYIILMLASISINWYLALTIKKFKNYSGQLLAIGVTINLLGIGVFKYGGFLVNNLNELLSIDWSIPNIALPIGISFYTFQAISYLVDTHRGTIHPQQNPLFFGTYLSMFPQLIAGPIVRYKTIEKEITERRENLQDFADGIRRFAIGLSKKVLIANTMGSVADTILSADPNVGAIPAWYGFLAYSLQIYFDFSGYSDMAIGLGKMFGFHFLENFNYPYISRSITEFWKRWHISLSSFFRDYVYIPLGGNRVVFSLWLMNLMLVWSLTGLWHGASWNFICWGVYYGLLLIGEKLLWGQAIRLSPTWFQHIYTLFFVIIGWVIFRIENFNLMIKWTSSLFGWHGMGNLPTLSALNVLHYYPWFIIAIIGSTPLFSKLMERISEMPTKSWMQEICIVSFFLWSIVELSIGGFNPFIYFRF